MAGNPKAGPARSQRDVRTTRIFTDEFGRQWRATVNNLGVHAGYPVSPFTPLFKAPMYPPPQYIKIIDIAAGTIKADIEAWLAFQEERHNEYEIMKHQTAVFMYTDGAAAAIERGDRALMYRIGPPPHAVEQILAYQQGHPWVLGLDPVKPKSLAAYFPEPAAPVARVFATASEEAEQDGVYTYSPPEVYEAFDEAPQTVRVKRPRGRPRKEVPPPDDSRYVPPQIRRADAEAKAFRR